MSRADLAADPLCGGSVAGIRKGLGRLVSRGLIEVAEAVPGKGGGKATNLYRAVLSRDMCVNKCPIGEEPSQGLESAMGQGDEVSHCSERLERENPGMIQAAAEAIKKQWDTPSPSPIAKASAAKTSAPMGQDLHISPRAERSAEEIDALMNDALDAWD
jgi:hypothetical protein